MTNQVFNMFNQSLFFSFALNEDGSLKEPLYQGILNEKILEYSSVDNLDAISNNAGYFNIYGQATNGKKFTAIQCFHKKLGSLSIPMKKGLLMMTKSIYVNQIFIGDWDSNIEINTIQKVLVQFSYLEHWLEKYQIQSDYDQDNDEFIYKRMNPQFNTIDINNKLQFRVVNQLNSSNKQFYDKTLTTFETQKFIELSFKENVTLDEMYEAVHILKNFFEVLLPKREIFKTQLEIINSNNQTYQVLQENKEEQNVKISFLDFLYLYGENDIQKVLSNWFEIENRYRFLIASLSPIFKGHSFTYAENEFIYYMQWLEGFARVEYPTDENETKEFQKRIDNIVEQISNDEDKELIQKKFEYYETPLRQQLKKLLTAYSIKDLLKLSSKNLDSLIDKLVYLRNKLTHTSSKQEYQNYEVIYLKNVLKQIIYIVFHIKLQLDSKSYAYQQQIIKDLQSNYEKYKLENKKVKRETHEKPNRKTRLR